ncbi:hypothetical protein [Lysinibacter sp. HNR]|uniref:hypothetical protein n=1 Tax=Lysinibacter sp. HNR TaxID=3031408 RepID=UPI002435DA7B|nr:hypothetical protein [Lysinibacter sp. HNR]WGD37429.1 hypothetical protein FrondiHNR_00465 [Lysinibacter sp. HNR]
MIPEQSRVSLSELSAISNTEISPTDWQVAIDGLISSNLSRTAKTLPTVIEYTFQVPVEGRTVAFTVGTPRDGLIAPRLGVGEDKNGPYILFNQTDQDFIAAGTFWVVGAALCAIPAVGWVGCTALTALLAAVGVFLANTGKCKNNKQLKSYIFNPTVGRFSCV